jgi:hypothetical protein
MSRMLRAVSCCDRCSLLIRFVLQYSHFQLSVMPQFNTLLDTAVCCVSLRDLLAIHPSWNRAAPTLDVLAVLFVLLAITQCY